MKPLGRSAEKFAHRKCAENICARLQRALENDGVSPDASRLATFSLPLRGINTATLRGINTAAARNQHRHRGADTATAAPKHRYRYRHAETAPGQNRPARRMGFCSSLTGGTTMRDPFTAGLLSFIIPGVGQLYNGRILAGILWLIITPGFWIGSGGTLGWICHLIAAYTAYSYAKDHPVRV